MDTVGNAILGIVFLLLGIAATFLMYKLWGYPFDHEKLKSSAPPRLLMVHHIIGYAYGAIYLYLMIQMVPRLWTYEVELPARTVAHMILGMSIGVIIIVKVVIVRFFKYLESTLVPFLGTGLLVCTFLLIGLSVPFAMKEVYLHRHAVGGTAFSQENIERVKSLIPNAGFPQNAILEELATVKSFKEGRDVLLSKCVQCHDLRTVLVKPRTPDNWVQTVNRMADRAVFNPISEEEQWRVAAYLIAISPELQKTFKQKRQQDMVSARSKVAAEPLVSLARGTKESEKNFELGACRKVFEATCTQCHKLSNVDKSPPGSAQEARELVGRMVENGLEAPEADLQQIVFYLTKTYTK